MDSLLAVGYTFILLLVFFLILQLFSFPFHFFHECFRIAILGSKKRANLLGDWPTLTGKKVLQFSHY